MPSPAATPPSRALSRSGFMPAKGAADRLMNSTACSGSASPSSRRRSAMRAIRNSIMPLGLSVRWRMKSSVQPTMRPSRQVGSQLVTPSTRPFASMAYNSRTRGSRSSSTPPSVNFISGSALSCAHSSEMSSICSRTSSDASRNVACTSVTPSRLALLMAVRTSCHFLPVVFHPRGSTTISLPTSMEFQPATSSASRCSRCTL